MTKGKFGLVLPVYGITALLLAIFGKSFYCFLLLGFVMVAENDKLTTTQVAEGALLSVFHNVLMWLFGATAGLFGWIPLVSNVINIIFIQVLGRLVWIAVLVFAILGVVNVAHGKEAKVPCAHAIVKKLFP